MNEKVKSFIYSFPLSQSFGNLTLDFLVLMEVQNIKLNVFLTCIGELSAAIAVKPTISLKLLSNSEHFYKAGARASFFQIQFNERRTRNKYQFIIASFRPGL